MSKTKDRMRENELRYRHSLGQNFIYDDDLLAGLVTAARVTPEEDVLEIGPGCGSLTKHLCGSAAHVTSVELDERLIPLLGAFMADYHNFTLIQGDVMKLDLAKVTESMKKPFAVVANIPYYITTPLITMLLSSGLAFSRLALMVQKEVADKILSKPGDDGWGPLAVRCSYLCEPYPAMDVPAACFTPQPKVDSAFIVLPRRAEPAVTPANEDDFFRIVSAAFALRRKTMTNNLCATFRLDRDTAVSLMEKAGLDIRVRGETMTLEELASLSDAWTAYREEH
ncbi:MAG: 16S rRNA (adenine(1518)-N(6)/adenine(1519)-N(6))-dimethyltransferase RsmA [Clostridia bacterium]|nr:16S rRNA (adenine(1518)-N(6)/adenine(1519)-N(6))-dimethyltransferase RsmA [Clostridia bacterium]